MVKKKSTKRPSHIKKSKTENFLEKIQTNNSMVEYITQLRIMNPAAQLTTSLNEPRREGGFVRLAHAREEFTAPILSKGKSVNRAKQTSRANTKTKEKAASSSKKKSIEGKFTSK
jgi:hypothetical protein